MDLKKIISACDHTLLSQSATWEDIRKICDDGIKYGTASVCIPSCYVADAAKYVDGKLPICTVIGFPNGYSTTRSKCCEAEEMSKVGADEIDMVINIGKLKSRDYDYVRNEITEIKRAANGKLLKVIIETCLLTDEEKIAMCDIVGEAGADFIKTSTGFSTGGATLHDIELFAKHVPTGLKIKAAGGIASLDDAEAFLNAGASRLGTSRIIKLAKAVLEA